MADNAEAFRSDDQTTSLGNFAFDEIGGVKYCRTKIIIGADGTNDGDVSSANPLPVTGTIIVSGSATAANQATGNTSLAAIQNAVELLDNAVSGNEFQVDIVSSALPTGAATAVKQPALGTAGMPSADVITVQGVTSMTPLLVTASAGTNLNTSLLALEAGGNLAAAATSLALLDNAVSGNEFQVDVLTVPANQTVNVNLLAGNAPNFGSGAAGAGTLRVFHASDDPAVVALQLLDNAVSGNSFAVTNAGTFAVQVDGAALTSLQLLDDAVFQHGEAHGLGAKGLVALGRDNSNSAVFGIPLSGAGAAVIVTGAGGLFPVTGNAAHDAIATGNPVLIAGYASAAAPTDVSGDADAVQAWFLRNGAQATVITAGGALIPGDATDGLLVNLGSNNDVTVTGSVTANAGTNLNTSALALETGGNLAACATSLAALDNAVAGNELQVDVLTVPANQTVNLNLIGGNSAVGGTGTVTSGTLRVTQGGAATATLTDVGDSASSVQLLASNTTRKGMILHNDSTAILYLKYGTTASTSSFTDKIAANATWNMPAPIFNGRIDGIWASDAGGNARITELT